MNPTFGKKIDGQNYQARYGVYAIITRNHNQEIVLVQAPNGAYFLPGGEIEAGEDHNQALDRELVEELGVQADEKSYLGQADEYFYSRHRDTYFFNPAYIYNVKKWHDIGTPLEDFNQIKWFPVQEAIKALKRGSHQWGIHEWLAQK
ncbi:MULTISPECIES: NUDIX hydrolase [unclassified Enterococcus]|uniref:NUDIX hydrolase n=1 Tax=unclassified Enterococcus TaxID=2608891 RepID=UPI001554FFCB|nr:MULTISPECIES: NUDIX hydrolase [unclassified Enterococcus]MBS7575935.1 NUDIX hydrolase [Enterococcus sp. MMGLQ5-2]MBS7583168.1 NUDIX hydrolase [Enterococcus sp. MMGLQ5-1]NPD11028.1 NUDIX hydrolase [Enterococcus sp. MMGLQ5-1]NPD35771.1 NUDIX hydrolase [Enterococcus sp. MMGLQ5-2]